MLLPFLILGYAVLVTSRPSSSIADDIFDGVTWQVLPPMLRQEPSQWLSPYKRPEPGKVTELIKYFSCVQIVSTGGTTNGVEGNGCGYFSDTRLQLHGKAEANC
jgi:hypothetical protein